MSVNFRSSALVKIHEKISPAAYHLFIALKTGSTDVLSKALREYPGQLDVRDEHGSTLLGKASAEGKLDLVKLLIEDGAEVNTPDLYGQNPLQYASEYSYTDIMKELISAGADVDWVDTGGLTALHIVACKGKADSAEILIEAGCTVDAQDINDVSSLHCAVGNNHLEVVQQLLDAGADVNITEKTERTPLHLAAELGNNKVIELMLKYKTIKLNMMDNFGLTPLSIAVIHNCTETAKLLIKAGAKINIADARHNLPIHYTARNGNLGLTQQLLDLRSPVNVLNKYFESPLHLAVRMGHVDMVRLLVDNGCDVNLCEPLGNVAAIHVAVNVYNDPQHFRQVLDQLVRGGCLLSSRAFSSLESPLYRAVELQKAGMAKALLEHGSDVNVECPFDVTVLHKACQKDLFEVVDLLIHCGIDWSRESWLDRDIHQSGINPKLLHDHERNIPSALIGKVELFFEIMEARCNPLTLMQICRVVIRNLLQDRLLLSLKKLSLPKSIENFIMLQEL